MFSDDIDTSYIKKSESKSSNTAIKIQNGNFYWGQGKPKDGAQNKKQEESSEPDKPILKNINMDIKKGAFVAILGEYFIF